MSDKNWADQAEALLKRRKALLREFSKLEGEARQMAEVGLDDNFKAQMRGIVGPWPLTNTITSVPPYTYTGRL